MPSKLKHSSFFRESFLSFKKSTQDSLRLLKTDVNSICMDSPQAYANYEGESNLTKAIPSNFFDNRALAEAKRSETYAIFPELRGLDAKGQPNCNLFSIKESFAKRGVDEHIQNRLINLMLQCRGAIQFGIGTPIQMVVADKKIVMAANTEALQLNVEVINPKKLIFTIHMPMNTPTLEGHEQVGILDFSLEVSKSSIYLQKMSYTKTSDLPIAEKILTVIKQDSYSIFDEIKDFIIKLLKLEKKEPDQELSLSAPVA